MTSELAMRFNGDKVPLSMIIEAKHALNGCAGVLSFGAKKYARGNWHKGLSHTEICDSLLRHMSAYLAGEDLDPESGLPHVDHIMCNALFLSEGFRTHPELDDRSEELKKEVSREKFKESLAELGKVVEAVKSCKVYDRPKRNFYKKTITVFYDNGFGDESLTCRLSRDGDKVCVMLNGEDFATTKLLGFGDTDVEAIADFRKAYHNYRQNVNKGQ